MILTSHLFVFPTTLYFTSQSLKKINSVFNTTGYFRLLKLLTLRNKRKLAALNREKHEEYPRISQERDTNAPGIQEDYITQVSEEIESRVTMKLSQELSRTKSCVLGALSKLDEFLLNPQVRVYSGYAPVTSQYQNTENQEPTEDRSQNDPHPEARVSRSQSSQNCCQTIPTRGCFLQYSVVGCIV